ncbi:DUF971 domain-containing protein [Methylopila henanensis]|uniref:DUF971 domain-containing protein n=1 Tax=Methylopila henanensis TaxID=873516 RepID=A0ABW4KBE6_9HYPH
MEHPLERIAGGQPPFDPADTPAEAAVRDAGRELRLSFHDGDGATLSAETLRLGCRCAWCTRARADGRFPAAFPGVAITAIEPLGGYAAHMTFDDGHDRGIYPWTYLRRLAAGETPPTLPARAA